VSGLSITDIVTRATSIHSAYVAHQRKSITAFPSAEEPQRLSAFKISIRKP
jgi:hypothetical protein